MRPQGPKLITEALSSNAKISVYLSWTKFLDSSDRPEQGLL